MLNLDGTGRIEFKWGLICDVMLFLSIEELCLNLVI
jgi:hypothetical protein